jgi:putative beta-lysine N-acetyltransferase
MRGCNDVMKIDQVEFFGHSVIQHGPLNDRVYLMKMDNDDLPEIITHIHELAMMRGYSKIFARVPATARVHFRQNDYRTEAVIPNFYNGREDGHFMARYYQVDRMLDSDLEKVQAVMAACEKETWQQRQEIDQDLEYRLATSHDCIEMSELYRKIFKSYPFPIDDPEYLRRTMDENVIYGGIWKDKKLLALSSAEVDKKSANAEMTDFATHPDCRGRGLAGVLLQKLEKLLEEAGIKTCYTIARATSFGMNITFARNNYVFAGTLINNTQISGSLESMNVWYKRI